MHCLNMVCWMSQKWEFVLGVKQRNMAYIPQGLDLNNILNKKKNPNKPHGGLESCMTSTCFLLNSYFWQSSSRQGEKAGNRAIKTAIQKLTPASGNSLDKSKLICLCFFQSYIYCILFAHLFIFFKKALFLSSSYAPLHNTLFLQNSFP